MKNITFLKNCLQLAASVVGTTVIASVVRIVEPAVPASVVGITAIQRFIPTGFVGTADPTRFVGIAVPTIIVLTAYYWKSCYQDGPSIIKCR